MEKKGYTRYIISVIKELYKNNKIIINSRKSNTDSTSFNKRVREDAV